MSEPIPQPVTLTDEQLEDLAIRIARYLPSYLVYRSNPNVPAGSVVPPEGTVVSSEDNIQLVPATAGVPAPVVETFK